jgi:hypothetical protein
VSQNFGAAWSDFHVEPEDKAVGVEGWARALGRGARTLSVNVHLSNSTEGHTPRS